jgi:hypothetical protein
MNFTTSGTTAATANESRVPQSNDPATTETTSARGHAPNTLCVQAGNAAGVK